MLNAVTKYPHKLVLHGDNFTDQELQLSNFSHILLNNRSYPLCDFLKFILDCYDNKKVSFLVDTIAEQNNINLKVTK